LERYVNAKKESTPIYEYNGLIENSLKALTEAELQVELSIFANDIVKQLEKIEDLRRCFPDQIRVGVFNVCCAETRDALIKKRNTI